MPKKDTNNINTTEKIKYNFSCCRFPPGFIVLIIQSKFAQNNEAKKIEIKFSEPPERDVPANTAIAIGINSWFFSAIADAEPDSKTKNIHFARRYNVYYLIYWERFQYILC